MSQIDRIRVRVVHDDPIAQAGLSAAFGRYSDLEVEDEAVGRMEIDTFLQRRGSGSADVIVADYANGIAIAGRWAREPYANAPRVMILAAVDREWEIRSALERGVRGYVLMGGTLDTLTAGVRAVHRGERHLGPQVAARLAESLSVEALTAREEEVLRLVVSGMCNKAIGKLLGIAVGTVKTHLKSTFDKLHVRSRTQAIAVVERRGLLRDLPQPSLATTRFDRMPVAGMNVRADLGHHAGLAA